MIVSNEVQLVNGYYQLKDKPSKDEIKKYYETKYYQEAKGSYEQEYSNEEITYIRNNLRRIQFCCEKIFHTKLNGKTILDIGCGEGWALNYFKKNGCNVKGVDFSSYGIKKFNPEVLDHFIQSDIFEYLENEINTLNKYNIINLTNVIEHVLEPEDLLVKLKNILSEDGIIIATFPNDFSPLQERLLSLRKIEREFWIAIPDHISYFNKESFSKMAKTLGFSVELMLAGFPVDIFLLNNFANYVKDKSKGKQAHFARIEVMNLLSEQNFNFSVNAFLNFGQIGFGRDLTAFLKIKLLRK
jgi:2-polyprenyl-3-methyl-5-hydroxy-6-metoxy-1,4-benzoquinol methylase